MPSNRWRRRVLLGGLFNPLRLFPRLVLDAWNETARRGLSTPILVDGFNRADGALGSAPTGQAWTTLSGTWSIASGAAKTALTDSPAIVQSGANMSLTDGRIQLSKRTTNTSAVPGIAFAIIDATNYLFFRQTTAGCIFASVNAGVFTTLATGGAALGSNAWNHLEVRRSASGLQLDGYLDGALVVSATLAGADVAKFGSITTTGMGRNGGTSATVEYKNFSVSTGASSMLLDKWSDDSGNGFDFTQATATKQPLLTWTVSATGILVPVVRTDGVDDIMRCASDISSAQQGHLHAAFARNMGSTFCYFSSADEAGTANYLEFIFASSSSFGVGLQQRNADTADTIKGGTMPADNTPYLTDTNSDGAAWSTWLNGVAQTLTSSSGSNTGDWFADTSGRDSFTIGAMKRSSEVDIKAADYHSVILTESTLGSNLLSLDRYNNSRYGMGISL